jgi:exodeoxyribonuclease VII small subunit
MAEADRPPPGGPPPSGSPPPRTEAEAALSGNGETTFEAALERLETLVERLEGGDLALEDALARFEEGVGLSRRLAEQLSSAEQRVERLLREGAGLVTRPLTARDVEDEEGA